MTLLKRGFRARCPKIKPDKGQRIASKWKKLEDSRLTYILESTEGYPYKMLVVGEGELLSGNYNPLCGMADNFKRAKNLRITSKEDDCFLELAWDEAESTLPNSQTIVSMKKDSESFMHGHYCETEGLTKRQTLEGFMDKVERSIGAHTDEIFISTLNQYTSGHIGRLYF